jgi:hypothetical protein
MSSTTITRIGGVLHRQFDGLIDMTDWASRPADHADGAFLSRALAALCIKNLAKTSPELSALALIDGFGDFGIDAIYFDAPADTLYLVQSKWVGSGNASFDEAAMHKFVHGVRRILAVDFEGAGAKIKAKEPEIRELLYSDRDIRIRLITAHTAKQPLAPHVRRTIDALIDELNDPVEIAEHDDFDQAGVYELITAESRDPKIKLQAVLNDWGVIEQPFLAYYGRVSVSQIFEWWRDHRNKLFSQNLRLYYQSSSVNDALRRTLGEDPESFWYFNNGITIIADKVIKGLAGSPAHKFGNFTCEGASVVNGAQTVGSIGSANESRSIEAPQDPDAWVQVRLISLEKCPPDFGAKITRAANLQNAVGNREFAAMDPLQHRLAVEFALDKRRYVYKSGEPDPRGEEGCSITEATVALACAHSARLAAAAKREIGSMWADTDRAPYTDIFTQDLSAEHVWRVVRVMRAADEQIHLMRSSDAPRADLLGTHMQRIILHLVLRDPMVVQSFRANADLQVLTATARTAVEPAFRKLAAHLEKHHPNEYLANFSKNAERCEALVAKLNEPSPPAGSPEQSDLFDSWVRNV